MVREIDVIGAGPAGAAVAAALARSGVKVTVYEALDRLAVKACGRAVPATSDLPLPIPRSSVIQEIRRAVLYVDGEKAVEVKLEGGGLIIDKEGLLEEWITSSGAELRRSSRYNPVSGILRSGGEVKEVRGGILAGGSAFYDGEKIMAVQAVLRPAGGQELDTIVIDFDTGLLGYYWIFPWGDDVDVGVGGFADAATLRDLLDRFIQQWPGLGGGRTFSYAGAPIAVGGVKLGAHRGLVKVGESAGFVLPLTGEGIRPSAISGFEVGRAIAEGRDPMASLRALKMARAIELQSSILRAVKGMAPSRRRDFLMSIPAEVHEEVALGSFRLSRITRALMRRPDILAKLLKYIGGGLGA